MQLSNSTALHCWHVTILQEKCYQLALNEKIRKLEQAEARVSFSSVRLEWALVLLQSIFDFGFNGEVHPKMITSNLVVFKALSRMVKVRGACDKPFWIYIYKRLNTCAAPVLDSDGTLVVEEEVVLCAGYAKEASTKTSSQSGAGAAQLFNCLYVRNGLSHAPRTFTIRLSAPNTTRYEVIIFG